MTLSVAAMNLTLSKVTVLVIMACVVSYSMH